MSYPTSYAELFAAEAGADRMAAGLPSIVDKLAGDLKVVLTLRAQLAAADAALAAWEAMDWNNVRTEEVARDATTAYRKLRAPS